MKKFKYFFIPLLVLGAIVNLSSCGSTTNTETQKQVHFVTPDKSPDGPVKFYSRRNPYGEFSNFALFPISIEGKDWPTSEHYYQAKKFLSPDIEEKIRLTEPPEKAAHLGRTLNGVKKDWHQIKDVYMWKALVAKYTQHDRLKKLLLSTESFDIFEHTENDHYWGDGGDGSGKNVLGKMLMKLRAYLKRDNGQNPDQYVWK